MADPTLPQLTDFDPEPGPSLTNGAAPGGQAPDPNKPTGDHGREVPSRGSVHSRKVMLALLLGAIFALSLTFGYLRAEEFSSSSGTGAGQAEITKGAADEGAETAGGVQAELVIAFGLVSVALTLIAAIGVASTIDVVHEYAAKLAASIGALYREKVRAEQRVNDLTAQLQGVRATLLALPTKTWLRIEAQLTHAYMAMDARAINTPGHYGIYRTTDEQRDFREDFAKRFGAVNGIADEKALEARIKAMRKTETAPSAGDA